MRVTLRPVFICLAFCVLLFAFNCRAGTEAWQVSDAGAGLADSGEFEPVDPSVQDALDGTADLLDQYSKISTSDIEYAYEDFRFNRLGPAIRKVSEIAKSSKNKEVLYCAVALASCDLSDKEDGFFWGFLLTDALRNFSANDISDAFLRLPAEGRERVKTKILKEIGTEDPLHDTMSKIGGGMDDYLSP